MPRLADALCLALLLGVDACHGLQKRLDLRAHLARQFKARHVNVFWTNGGRELAVMIDPPLTDMSEASKAGLARRVAEFLRDYDAEEYDSSTGINVDLRKREWWGGTRFVTARWFPRDSLGPARDTLPSSEEAP